MNGRNLVALPVRHQDCFPYILRLVPALNLAALKARPREDKQLFLWYYLRSIDVTGRGVLAQEQAIHTLEAIVVNGRLPRARVVTLVGPAHGK